MKTNRRQFLAKGMTLAAAAPLLPHVVAGTSEAGRSVPIARAGRPEEIASVVLWLCSPGASYVLGHRITADGGMTVV